MSDRRLTEEKILGPAIRRPSDGQFWYAQKPHRHGDVIHTLATTLHELNGVVPGDWEQGFATTRLRYVDRREAMAIAIREKQFKPRREGNYKGPELYTEDLW